MKKWFWAENVIITVPKRRSDQIKKGIVWHNLILIEAMNASQAITKARRFGKREAGDCRGTLRLDGAPAIAKYLGVKNIGLVHDGVRDGAEITYKEKRMVQLKAKNQVKTNAQLLQILQRELNDK